MAKYKSSLTALQIETVLTSVHNAEGILLGDGEGNIYPATFDETPTLNSGHLVSSGVIYDAIRSSIEAAIYDAIGDEY